MNEPFISFDAYGTRASVRLRGAQLASLITPDGQEMMWNGDPAVWPQHAPLLFPICGLMRDDTVRIEGKPYPMFRHGFTRDGAFRLTESGTDHASFELTDDASTYASYPFRFRFTVRYTLDDSGCRTDITVENRDDRAIPFCLGGHPGFRLPMEDGAAFEDYQLVFDEPENGVNLLSENGIVTRSEVLPELAGKTILPVSHAYMEKKGTIILPDVRSRAVSLVHRVSGRGIRFEYPDFHALAIWTADGKKAPYLCIEPWNGLPDSVDETGDLEKKPYVTMLSPGACCHAQYAVHRI